MSIWHFGLNELAGIMLVCGGAPGDLELLSRQNTAAFRKRYMHHPEYSEASHVEAKAIEVAAPTIPVSAAMVSEAIADASRIAENMTDDENNDRLPPPVQAALARVLASSLRAAQCVLRRGDKGPQEYADHEVRERSRKLSESREKVVHRRRWRQIDEVVTLTGVHCDGSISEMKPGDSVSERLYFEVLEVLPPVCMDSDLLQLGEASNHDDRGEARYLSVQKHGAEWICTGHQAAYTRVRIQKA